MISQKEYPFIVGILVLLLLVSYSSNCNKGCSIDDFNYWKTNHQQEEHPRDMVLIYDGGAHRNIDWAAEHFAPYVAYKDKSGTDKRLFDGFLFLEIKDGNGRCFTSYYEKEGARQSEWKALVDNYFQKGSAIIALDDRIRNVIKKIKLETPEKREVVLCLPEPIPNQKDWGQIGGISEATNSRDLAVDVSNYIHRKGYNFYWIPYFKSDGYREWRTMGFDKAYYQLNCFFNKDRPIHQIEEDCQSAIDYGMSLEMEFDERALFESA